MASSSSSSSSCEGCAQCREARRKQTLLGSVSKFKNKFVDFLQTQLEGHSASVLDFDFNIRVGKLSSSLRDGEAEDEGLAAKFLLFHCDEEMQAFLEGCDKHSNSTCLLMWEGFVSTVLTPIVSRTGINGLLLRGSMFICSSAQFRSLLSRREAVDREPRTEGPYELLGENMLDIGAGDGLVTEKFSKFFRTTYATESCPVMKYRLKQRGFRCLEVETWHLEPRYYDVISCLNVLDRCSDPIALLKMMRDRLTPGIGRLLIALVLPYTPWIEIGTKWVRPPHPLPISGRALEEQFSSFVANVLTPLGLRVEVFTKAPYLCAGDWKNAFYLITDFVLVCSVDPRFSQNNE